MNHVTLIGRWTKDLELKFTPGNGTAVATGTLAVERRFSKDNKKEADFINIVIWGKIAENAVTYTGKGKQCAVSGRIQVRNYDAKDGTKRYVTEVVAEEVQFLEWIKSGENTSNNGGFMQNNNFESYGADITPVDDGDDIPF